jgi:hypothetical protein
MISREKCPAPFLIEQTRGLADVKDQVNSPHPGSS